MGHTANATSETTVVVAIGESIQGDSEIENGKFDNVFGSLAWIRPKR